MLRTAFLATLSLGIALSALPAGAQQASSELPPPPEEDHGQPQIVSLTFSPLHLIFPIFEATVEVRLADLVGVAVIGGAGSISFELDGEDHSFSTYQLGAQGIVYPIEPFESLQFGMELMYAHLSFEDLGDAQVSGYGGGVAVGPFVGYKLLTAIGFTLVVQGGVLFIAARAEAKNDAGESATADDDAVLPSLNLNLGWSF